MPIVPNVVDLHHARTVDFGRVKAAGIWGVIHKCSQGTGYRDPLYRRRRDAAKEAGLLWGAYDFSTHDDVAANVKAFLDYADLGPEDSAWLDFEDNTRSQMTASQALEFLDRASQRLGRPCGIYGGNRIREQVNPHFPRWQDAAKVTPLWQCRYIRQQPASNEALFAAILPIPPWTKNTLIQYTGDGSGPLPHTVPGLQGGDDLNVFLGDRDFMAAVWAGGAATDARPAPVPEAKTEPAPERAPQPPSHTSTAEALIKMAAALRHRGTAPPPGPLTSLFSKIFGG